LEFVAIGPNWLQPLAWIINSISLVASQCSSHGTKEAACCRTWSQLRRKLQTSWQYISWKRRLSRRVNAMPVSTPCQSNDSSGLRTIEWASFFNRQRLMVVLGASPTMPTKTVLKVLVLTWQWLASSAIAMGRGKCCSKRLADFLKISAADANVEERTRKRLIQFKPQNEAFVPYFYSRSSSSAVRHATNSAARGNTAPKPWQRLCLQQDTPAKLLFLQTSSGLAVLGRAPRRKGWMRSLRGCPGPEGPWGWEP